MALLEKKSTISVADAAKELAVPKVVIDEWVEFLEERGVIQITYKFTTPYINKKELTKTELDKKTKEFTGKKEGFVRKIETAYKSIDNAGDVVAKIKEEFGGLSKELDKDVVRIKTELETLQKYEQLKLNLDKDLIQAQNAFKADMKKIESAFPEYEVVGISAKFGTNMEEFYESLFRLSKKRKGR